MQREAIVLITSLISVSCGGSSATQPRHAEDDTAEFSNESDEPGDPLADGEVSAPDKQDPCQGAQCSSCGSAVCLEGFFCDEQAMACSWLPQCASEPGCDCINKVLPECTCEERDGGTYVTCE